jgi:hypothetical protein
MGAMKRELERLADIVIYGNAETIEREFEKVSGLHDNGALGLLAYAIGQARYMSPLCECGADYHEGLKERFPQWIADTNEQSAAECSHNYGVEKGISFCLECGEFEDFLEVAGGTNA